MFVCTASIIYRAAFILISAGAPTEKNHNFFFCFFFTDTDVSHGSKGKQGTIFGSLYHFHEYSDIDLQFCIMFNTYKHLCVLGKQKCTMAV